MALDTNPSVAGVASQPMWLHWTTDDGKLARHAPDFFARLDDGTAVLIDVRADDQVTPEDAAAFATTASAVPDIRGWIQTWNTDPKPFVRTKTTDQILASLAAYCTRLQPTADAPPGSQP